MNNDNFNSKYPVDPSRYRALVGRLLPRIIEQIFQELGFDVRVDLIQNNGVDLTVFNNANEVFLVGEILNWSPYSLLSRKRKECIKTNLCNYDCKRVLFYTAMENDYLLESLHNKNIDLLCLDNQVLPKDFFDKVKVSIVNFVRVWYVV